MDDINDLLKKLAGLFEPSESEIAVNALFDKCKRSLPEDYSFNGRWFYPKPRNDFFKRDFYWKLFVQTNYVEEGESIDERINFLKDIISELGVDYNHKIPVIFGGDKTVVIYPNTQELAVELVNKIDPILDSYPDLVCNYSNEDKLTIKPGLATRYEICIKDFPTFFQEVKYLSDLMPIFSEKSLFSNSGLTSKYNSFIEQVISLMENYKLPEFNHEFNALSLTKELIPCFSHKGENRGLYLNDVIYRKFLYFPENGYLKTNDYNELLKREEFSDYKKALGN